VQWIGELPLKLATGFEPPIVQRQKRLRQLIWYIGPWCCSIWTRSASRNSCPHN